MKYRSEVDGLRAVAVLPVILFHAGFSAFAGGFVGVDVFFVISGFLITSILLGELDAGTFRLLNFYERRARRLLPALFVVLAASLAAAWFLLLPTDFAGFSKSLASVGLFSSNWVFWRESGYFDGRSELKPLLHTWSLAVEEQFYFLYPLLLLLLSRFAKRLLPVALVLLGLASFLLAEWASRANPSFAFFLLPTRGWELLLGAFCALQVRGPRSGAGSPQVRDAAAWVGLILIGISVTLYSSETPFPGAYALLPTVGTALVLLFADGSNRSGRFLGWSPFVWVGKISYSAYLWHQPLFAFARHARSEPPSVAMLWLLVAASLLLGFLSYRYVEAIFRNGRRFTRAQVFASAAALSLAFVAAGAFGYARDGVPGRFSRIIPKGEVGHEAFFSYLEAHYLPCASPAARRTAPDWRGRNLCKQSKPGQPDVVILGDSHAEHLFPGLADALPKHNVAYFHQKAAPFLNEPKFEGFFAALREDPTPKTILLGIHFALRQTEGDAFYTGLTETVKALTAAGHRVVLLGDLPILSFDPARCLYHLPFETDLTCSETQAEGDRQRAKYEALLQRVSRERAVPYLQLDGEFCDGRRCSARTSDTILYRDWNHLNLEGSRRVGRYLAPLLFP